MSLSRIRSFTLLFLLFSAADAFSFDAGEHAIIGDVAYSEFEQIFPNDIKNLEADISFSYGQLVAMSADMYISVEEISLNDPGILNGFFHRNRNSLKNCINQEIQAIRTKSHYAGCDDVEFAKKKIQYVALAHDNYGHFAWHNIKQYIELHNKALWFAQLAHLKCTKQQQEIAKPSCDENQLLLNKLVADSDYRTRQKSKYRRFPKLFPRKRFSKNYFLDMPKEKMIRLALFTNAYADHYLTDSFSAGHLRIPRSQIDKFVEVYDNQNSSINRQRGSSVSGALTQFLHNLDGSLSGIEVINSLGQKFKVRSDKQLFSKLNSRELSGIVEDNAQLEQPIEATKKSLEDIFSVIENGKSALPNGHFAALKYVPFVANPKQDSLALRVEQHIEQQGSIKKVIKSMSLEMQLIYRSTMAWDDISYKRYFENFVASIPTMMQELRIQIETETQNEEIRKRIPSSLLSALKKLN